MKVTFISNYLTHHQRPFSEAMMNLPGVTYHFVSTKPMEQERREMGWQEDAPQIYEVRAYENEAAKKQAEVLALESDVVIIGSAPDAYIIPRLKERKLTFKYAERFYKEGITVKNYAHVRIGAWLHHGRYQKYPLYMLCASAYTAADCMRFHNYKNRMFRWGYFPEKKETVAIEKTAENKVLILWTGRMLAWKHPEAVIQLAARLKEAGYDFQVTMIGTGPLKDQIQDQIEEGGLTHFVTLQGAMTPEQVRIYMEQADIYLFTSDFMEGWGAVVNEAMNSRCAVVASHAAGAVPFLIQQKENGLIYECDNQKDLEAKVIQLMTDPALRKKMAENAYRTITEVWNAETAAKRLVVLAQALLDGEDGAGLFAAGPCSRAEIIKNDWFPERE